MKQDVVKFTVPGNPVGKARPRMTRSGHAYTPDKTVSYENLVKMCFIEKYTDWVPVSGEAILRLNAYYPIPKSASRKKKIDMVIGEIRPTKKPDLDNVMKAIADALNGIAYVDDSQIVTAEVRKYYDDTPRVEVVIDFRRE